MMADKEQYEDLVEGLRDQAKLLERIATEALTPAVVLATENEDVLVQTGASQYVIKNPDGAASLAAA